MAKFAETNPTLFKLIAGFAAFVAIAAPLLIALGALTVGFGSLAVVVGAISWPVLAVVAALAALYFGLKYLAESELGRAFFDGLFGGIEWIQGQLTNFIDWFMSIPSILAGADWSGILMDLLSALNPLSPILKLAGIDISGSQSVDVNVKVGAEKGTTAKATVSQTGKRGANMK
jgi:hypothetical protein